MKLRTLARRTLVRRTLAIICAASLLLAPVASCAEDAKKKKTDVNINIDDPKEAEKRPDFRIQGEYVAVVEGDSGEEVKLGVQVAAQGNRKTGRIQYRGYIFHGGLPGAGWDGKKPGEASGFVEGGVCILRGEKGYGEIRDGKIHAYSNAGEKLTTFKRIDRKSPTLGKKPPKEAVVLFDGKSMDKFSRGKMTKGGLLIPRADTKEPHGSGHLHVEFRVPYQPYAEKGGQGRGNSGVYLQSRFEVQVLDSFTDVPETGHCGGIYSIAKAKLTMSYPPLSWQTYDIDFKAAEFGDDGKLIQHARMTVRHNGVLIHDNVECDHSTTASPVRGVGPEPKPLHIQDHGNKVRFRNIWFVPREESN